MDGNLNLDDKFRKNMDVNMMNYKRDIDRITRKYEGGLSDDVNVDLHKLSDKALCQHLRKMELKMSLLEQNTSIDSGEQSLRAQDTSDTQWDNTLQECEADVTDFGSNNSSQNEGVSGINNAQLSHSFLFETQGSQPEDQDEELEKTLSSHGTSLVELYPRMIDQLSKAVYSQQVSVAADSVLRKYRRQIFRPDASHLNHTLDASVRAHDRTNPKKNKGKVVRKRNPQPLHTKKVDAVESKYSPDVLIAPSFVTKILQRQHLEPTESPRQRDQPTGRSGHLTIDGFRSQSPRSVREDIGPLLTCNTAHEKESFTVTDSSGACSYPVRRSPFKTWLRNLERQSGMSHVLAPSPKSDTAGSHSRHLGQSRSRSASPLSSPQKSIMSPRKHHYDSPSQSKVNSCQSPSRIHKLHTPQRQSHYRHAEFTRSRSESPHSSLQKFTMSPRKHHHCSDSPSQPKIYSRQSTTGTGHSVDVSTCHNSSKMIDMEFQRVYHRLICLGNSVPSDAPPCSVCTRHMDANRAMAALALSPHRSLLRKRHRELEPESPRSNKRFRDRCDVSSPGSLRHLREILKAPSSRRLLYSTGPGASQ